MVCDVPNQPLVELLRQEYIFNAYISKHISQYLSTFQIVKEIKPTV